MKLILLIALTVFTSYCKSQTVICDRNGQVVAYEASGGKIKSANAESLKDIDTVTTDSAGISIQSIVVSGTITVGPGIFELIDTSYSHTYISVSNDTAIANATGSLIGRFNAHTSELLDSDDHIIFTLDNNGEIRNAANALIGTIDEDGKVYEPNGFLIGQGLDVPKYKLAYFFFYSNR